MNTPLLIEDMKDGDSKAIIDLVLPIQQLEHNVPVTLEDQPDLLHIEQVYHQSGGGFWGVRDKDEIVGTIALIHIGECGGVIRKMFVKKEYRGKELGIAGRLLDHVIAFCATEGITDLYLGTVHTLKAALRFYERNGFTLIEKKDLPPAFPVMAVDNVFCHLNLKNKKDA
jgi:putative acetyltransferase